MGRDRDFTDPMHGDDNAPKDGLQATGKQGAAGAPRQDVPSAAAAETATATAWARQGGSMAARMGRARESPPLLLEAEAAAWLEGYDEAVGERSA